MITSSQDHVISLDVSNPVMSHVWHDSFICVTWLIHMCDMTQDIVTHPSMMNNHIITGSHDVSDVMDVMWVMWWMWCEWCDGCDVSDVMDVMWVMWWMWCEWCDGCVTSISDGCETWSHMWVMCHDLVLRTHPSVTDVTRDHRMWVMCHNLVLRTHPSHEMMDVSWLNSKNSDTPQNSWMCHALVLRCSRGLHKCVTNW